MDKSILSNKIQSIQLIMTMYMYVLTNYVPAVAVIRKRLVLFIFIRFKGYSNGKISCKKDSFTRVLYKEVVLVEER